MPTIDIASVSHTGLVTIQFSDSFVVLHDLVKIKTEQMLELTVVSYSEGDETGENLKFDWEVMSFTENEMTIQLKFEGSPYEISSGELKDMLKIKVKDYDIFVRQSDGFYVLYDTQYAVNLPLLGDNAVVEVGQVVGGVVGSIGKSEILIIFLLRILGSFQLNKLLGQVRNLNMMMHFMLL